MFFSGSKKKFVLLAVCLVGLVVVSLYFLGYYSLKSDRQRQAVADLVNYRYQPDPASGRNFTRELADNIMRQVATANASHPDSSALAVPSGQALETITASTLANFNPQDLKPHIADADVKIASASDRSALLAYLKDFAAIISASSLPVESLSSYTTLADVLSLAVSTYENAIRRFYDLPVPPPLLAIHKEEIALLSGKLIALNYLRDYDADPLKALIALQASEYFDREFVVLKESLNQFISDHNLTL